MAALDDKYIVFGAETECSMGLRKSRQVLPADHGIFIRGKAQMHAKDCMSPENVIPFGGCRSASNPSTALKMASMGVSAGVPTISGTFCAMAVAPGCAGLCTPVITSVEWEDASEFTDIDEEKALMGRCTLTCAHGGIIKITDAGQG